MVSNSVDTAKTYSALLDGFSFRYLKNLTKYLVRESDFLSEAQLGRYLGSF